jgi:hypothetical protein
MNKNVIAVFAAVCGLSLASCDTPKDLRPSEKASTEMVAPGTRNTFNVSDAGGAEVTAHGEVQHATDKDVVMPNHDMGGNTIQPKDSIKEKTETNTESGATKH